MNRRGFHFRLATAVCGTSLLIERAGAAADAPHLPDILRTRKVDCARLAAAVNHYVRLGEDATVREFKALARLPLADRRGFALNERIGWLCRILYEPKKEPLRRPFFGALRLPHASMTGAKWPLYPVARSNDTYIILSEGYSLAGLAEPVPDYLAYCRKSGVFRTKSVKVPTQKSAMRDVAKLRSSQRWKDIKWKDEGNGFRYEISENWIWQGILKQAKSIEARG